MGRLLIGRGYLPDCIVASPAERTAATARIVAAACGFDPARIVWPPELYLADAEGYWQVLEARAPALCCVLLCGHNPGVSRLASRLGKPVQPVELPPARFVTGVWQAARWRGLEPGAADDCEAECPDV
jgi:phosphohistidine phosphatase